MSLFSIPLTWVPSSSNISFPNSAGSRVRFHSNQSFFHQTEKNETPWIILRCLNCSGICRGVDARLGRMQQPHNSQKDFLWHFGWASSLVPSSIRIWASLQHRVVMLILVGNRNLLWIFPIIKTTLNRTTTTKKEDELSTEERTLLCQSPSPFSDNSFILH